MAFTQKLQALVIKRRDIGEADRLVTLFTREEGLIEVLAKGVRKIPSRRGGHLEPFTSLVTFINGSSGKYFLSAAETVDDYLALRQHSASLEHAESARALLTLLTPNEAHENLFDAIGESWRILPTLPAAKRRILEVTIAMSILQAAGLRPELNACASCGAKKPAESAVLNADDGGWRCLSCYGSWTGAENSLTNRTLSALRWIDIKPQSALRLALEEEESSQLLEAVQQYCSFVKANLEPSYAR